MSRWARLFTMAGRDVVPPRFSPEDEALFRQTLRRNLVYARTGIFLALALGFGLAPFYQGFLFNPDPAVVPTLVWIELLVLPLTLAAAYMTAVPGLPRHVIQATQSAAILASLLAVVALRYFALKGAMDYPAQMVGIVMIAAAFFGAFSWRRMVAGSAVAGALAIALEFTYGTPQTAPWLQSYTLLFMMVIAAASAYTQETLMRITWWESIQLRRVRAALHMQTITDELTGHYNRRGFNAMADQALSNARSLRQSCALLFIDVDDLKGINDRHGHEAGDKAIVAVGEALRVCSRNNDIVARVGGDEFLVFAADCRSVDGLRRRIANALQEASAAWALPFSVSACIGATEVPLSRDVPIEKIVAEADARMLEDKRSRARVPAG
jgi:diguanylate cyclase (GGDEF)-like protein